MISRIDPALLVTKSCFHVSAFTGRRIIARATDCDLPKVVLSHTSSLNHNHFHAFTMISAAFSAIPNTAVCRCPLIKTGMMLASTTLKFFVPYTFS